MPNELLLASASRYKKALLERLNIPFSTKAADFDETPLPEESPGTMVKRLAIAKAQAVVPNYPAQWVIGCDQVAQLDGEILGKPGDIQNAAKQLRACSARQVEFITGVALVQQESNLLFYEDSIVKVKFLPLTEQQIEQYLSIDKPFDCAGSFKVEAMGISLFEWVKSEDPTSLEGLPLISLCRLFRQAGLEPLDRF